MRKLSSFIKHSHPSGLADNSETHPKIIYGVLMFDSGTPEVQVDLYINDFAAFTDITVDNPANAQNFYIYFPDNTFDPSSLCFFELYSKGVNFIVEGLLHNYIRISSADSNPFPDGDTFEFLIAFYPEGDHENLWKEL